MREIHLQRVAPAEIEARSMEIIASELGERDIPAPQLGKLLPRHKAVLNLGHLPNGEIWVWV